MVCRYFRKFIVEDEVPGSLNGLISALFIALVAKIHAAMGVNAVSTKHRWRELRLLTRSALTPSCGWPVTSRGR
jgi:hypothetical protein